LLVVDVAVPRDVDPGARQVPAVTLLDMDDLKRFTERSLEGRRREVGRVQGIIMDELERFQTDRTAREMAPILTSLRQRADAIRVAELERFRAKLNGLPPETRNAVEALTLGIVNKLLHEPTVRLKDAAGTARGELYADALGALFDLPDGFADEPTEE
jgi:glutamyl-tRNA reductase